MAGKPAWKRGDFFLLGAVQFLPESEVVRVWYENHEAGEAPAHVLWDGRPGNPDWPKVRIDPETRGALLVPTLPSGEVAEIPSDVVRAATDVDYRAYVTRRAALWAKRVGKEVCRLREAQGWTQQQLAEAARIDLNVVSAVERGRQEYSLSAVKRLLEAMGADVPDWLTSGSN